MSQVIAEIISQHAEEAAFLWLLRHSAMHAPHYLLADLSRLDNRIEAQLDGLRVSGESGLKICREVLGQQDVERIFAAAFLSFENSDDLYSQINSDMESCPAPLCRGLVSALGWLPYARAEKHIGPLVSAASPVSRRVGIAASAIHRRDPGQPLANVVVDENLFVRARALRAAGELGRLDLLSSVQKNLTSEDADCRFWAAWAAALLGDLDSVDVLKLFPRLDVPYKEQAVIVALRRMDVAAGGRWQKELAENPEWARLAVIGAGAIGDPTLIPWLLEQMKIPELARLAGESFTMITGVDIAYEGLEGEQPEGFESGPTEDPEDENVEMDTDENLPWPNRALIQKWWNDHRSNFQNGTRYLIGKPIAGDWLQHVLRIGRQRQRAAAALELVLRQPGQPLFEVRAPGFRQQQMLGLKVSR